MIETLIVADDLSGAADCAIACAAAGVATFVIMDPKADVSVAAAVSLDVNSRAMAAQDAGAAAVEAVQQLYGKSTRVLYQKMDSSLRGNWATELVHIRQAAATILGQAPFTIVAPAFPETGRVTINGHVFVNGTALEDTDLWKQAGLTGSADIQLLLTEAGLKVELATLEQIALGPEALKMRLAKWIEADCDAVVCDAQTEDDLLTVATTSRMLAEKPLWVGSAGLMRALVRGGERSGPPSSAPAWTMVGKPILAVVGSASSASHTQFDALAAQQGITSLVIEPSALREGGDREQLQTHIQALDRALASGSDLAMMIGGRNIELQEGPQLAAALAKLIAPRLFQVGGLIVTGGETARAILIRASVSGLRMAGELEPGVPIGLSIGDIAIPVITKAGAFGDRMTLVRCHAALRDHRSDPPKSMTNG
jgi:D-threonate/D-erythronate kinase